MSSTIYMYISVHKKNPIKIGEGKNEYVLTHTWFSGRKFSIYSFFRREISVYTRFSGGENSVYTHFSGEKNEYGGKMSM
jgi:hypothetical protein